MEHLDHQLNLTTATNPDAHWLFPGRHGGQPMTPDRAATQPATTTPADSRPASNTRQSIARGHWRSHAAPFVLVPTVTVDSATRLLTQSQASRQADGFLLTLRSTPNLKAVEILRRSIERNYEQGLAVDLGGEHPGGRAALLIAICMGILLMREVLGNAALTSEDATEFAH